MFRRGEVIERGGAFIQYHDPFTFMCAHHCHVHRLHHFHKNGHFGRPASPHLRVRDQWNTILFTRLSIRIAIRGTGLSCADPGLFSPKSCELCDYVAIAATEPVTHHSCVHGMRGGSFPGEGEQWG